MAGADDIIATLLAGTGFGRTPGDVSMQNAQITGQQQQNQIGAMQIGAYQQQQAQDQRDKQRFDAFSADYGANPTPDKLVNAMVQFPKQYQALKAAHDAKDAAAQTADLGYWSGIHSTVSAGKYDKAVSAIEDRVRAEKAANPNADTSIEEGYIAGLRSGDPDTIKAVKAQSLIDIAVALGKDKFAENYKAMGGGTDGIAKGQVVGRAIGRYGDDGQFHVDYRDPEAPQYRNVEVRDDNGNIVRTDVVAVGGEGGGQASSGGAAPSGGAARYTGGWTPRARNGGNNTDAAVDGKISGMTSALGIDAQTPFPPGMSNMQIAKALSLSEGGAGSLADRNNNPTNLTDGKGGYRKFGSNEQALTAAAAQVARNRSRGQNTIQSMVEGLPAKGAAAPPQQGAQPVYRGQVVPAAPGSGGGGLSDEEANYYAQQVAAGGVLPALGSGKEAAATRRQILAKAAQINIARNIGGAQANLLKADLKANTTSLTDITKLQSMVGASERTAGANLDQVLKLAPAGVGGSAPIFNRWINSGRRSVAGDPQISAFDAAITTAANEYAKVMTSQSGTGGVTSDSARNEAREILNHAQTLGQIRSTIHQMKVDMANRGHALETQRQILSGNISYGAGPSQQPQSQSAPVRVTTPAQAAALPSGTLFVTPDGRTLRKR